jgi:hypothetical protein
MKLVVLLSSLVFAVSCFDDGASEEAGAEPKLSESEQAIGIYPRGVTCSELGLGGKSFTLTGPVASGIYTIEAQNTLRLQFYEGSNTRFFFTQSSIRMTGVLVSTDTRTMMWDMPGGADGWPSLTGPPRPGTGEITPPEEITFCYDNELYVQASPVANMSRRATWGITKTGRTTPLVLGEGDVASLSYNVTMQNTGMVPLGQFIGGAVYVHNKSPSTVTVSSVTTLVGNLNATVTCPTAPPFTMPPFTQIECSFRADVPDTADRLVMAGGTVSHGLRVTTREVTASFAAPNTGISTTDRCVAVFDTASPAADRRIGTVCLDGGMTLSFSTQVGPFDCGAFSVANTASFTTFDTSATGSAGFTVSGEVVCDPGCTRRWEYWRDHPNDPTWALLGPAGRNTAFFSSGTSYHGALSVLPLLNPYWILAREYVAARLNQLTGVDYPANTQAAFSDGTAIFNSNSPLQILLNLFIHGRVNSNANVLERFNRGIDGPGTCQ